jgi:3-methylfumaryl-CoA hydratase
VSKITRAEEKQGRSGPFKLITLRHELSAGNGIAMTEEQDVVYREPHAAGSATPSVTPPQATPHAIKSEWSRAVAPDPVLLFRYSALTFNAHRIHYDLPYTRDIEGYPSLVMNGGLTALLLVETARKNLPRPIAGYDARAVHPLFVGQSISFNGRIAGEGAELWACGPRGTLAYQVNVLLGPRP